jgi:PTH1 family peptidyl-tRNA hydrolase
MKLIVGLGNPGEKYKDTRHNVGFMVVDKIARDLSQQPVTWEFVAKEKTERVKLKDVVLIKPQTFMNASGVSVRSMAHFYGIHPDDIWVIHDDLDLPVGKIRIRKGGASAGHHGVDSIIRELKTDQFVRIRLGIGRGKEARIKTANKNFHRRFVIDFVLSRFSRTEAGDLKHLVKKSAEAVTLALTDGIEKAMNRFN